MDISDKQKLVDELEIFYKELRSYKNRLLKSSETAFTEAQKRSLDALRIKLLRKHGSLSDIISKYAGGMYVPVPFLGTRYEVFSHSLNTPGIEFRRIDALDGAISLISTTIGKLEAVTKKSIKDKQEIGGTESEKTNKHNDTAFGKAYELTLKSTPDVISPIIKRVIDEFKYKDLGYYSIEEKQRASPIYRKIAAVAGEVMDTSIGCEDCIGIITLQSLGNDKTLFRIPPRDQWYICIKPKTLPNLQWEGHVNKHEFYLFFDESCFINLYEKLLAEFKRLNFIETLLEKVWRLFKEFIGLAKAVRP